VCMWLPIWLNCKMPWSGESLTMKVGLYSKFASGVLAAPRQHNWRMTMQSLPGNERPLILYIEDEPDLCEDVADELNEAGYSVVLASDGEQALQRLASLRPVLILCDITMPRMSGYELLQALRQTRPDMAD